MEHLDDVVQMLLFYALRVFDDFILHYISYSIWYFFRNLHFNLQL